MLPKVGKVDQLHNPGGRWLPTPTLSFFSHVSALLNRVEKNTLYSHFSPTSCALLKRKTLLRPRFGCRKGRYRRMRTGCATRKKLYSEPCEKTAEVESESEVQMSMRSTSADAMLRTKEVRLAAIVGCDMLFKVDQA